MNVQLPLVVSDITGATGMAIIRDIVVGQQDPQVLARHRDPRCHASVAEIVAALTGSTGQSISSLWRRSSRSTMCIRARALRHGDRAGAGDAGRELSSAIHAPGPTRGAAGVERARANEPTFDIRTPLHQLTGVDLSRIDGIGRCTAAQARGGDRHGHEPLADRAAL